MLYELTYCSTSFMKDSDDNILNLLARSIANNEKNELTGILVYSNQFFLQRLKGDRAAINFLLKKLFQDHRHFKVQIISSTMIQQRAFQNWEMGLASTEFLNPEFLSKYMKGNTFDPYQLTSENVLEFLQNLKSSEHFNPKMCA